MGSRDRTVAGDRRTELAALDTAMSQGLGPGALIVVRGPAGIGTTALLDAAASRWRAAGMQLITTRRARGGPLVDPFGFRMVVAAVRDHFEQLDDPRLIEAVGALGRLCDQAGAASSPAAPLSLVLGLGNAFGLIAGLRPTALLIDDIHLVPAPALALGAARRPGCVVVAAGHDGAGASSGLAQLIDMADQVIDLPALPEDRIEAMLTQVRGVPVDEAVLPALRTALGPLFGNPGTVRGTLDDLERQGRFLTVRGQLCLVDPGEPIAMADGHDLVNQVHRSGSTAQRLATAVAIAPLGVDDLPLLADACGGQVASYGRMADQLIDTRVLRLDPDGVLRCACPALGSALTNEAGPDSIREIHLSLATALWDRCQRGDPVDEGLLADQVAAAGEGMAPDPALAVRLEAMAKSGDTSLDRSAQWLHSAWWHVGADLTGQTRILRGLLRMLVAAGEFEHLGTVVEQVLRDGPALAVLDPRLHADLAGAAMLASVHVGRPPAAATVAALPEVVSAGCSAADQVDGPDPLLSTAELAQIAGAIDGGLCGPDTEQVATAGALGDLATVFGLVLGERYGRPLAGPLAAYQGVLRGYARGDFAAGLAAARQLELTGWVGSPVHVMGRLFAVEMCTLRGEFKRAAAWLDEVPTQVGCPALRAWVECGLLAATSAALSAVEVGWQAFTQVRTQSRPQGLNLLIPRLAELAMRCGQRDRAEELLASAERAHEIDHFSLSMEVAMLTRALVHEDPAAAQVSAELAGKRAHRPATVQACLVVAGLVEDPRPWLCEAYETAKLFGTTHARSRISALMRQRGISTPRARPARAAYSAVELRIVKLIRDGWTNRQIAMEIRMSEKTIENYLTRLFARTGCRSRVELAAASLAGQLDVTAP